MAIVRWDPFRDFDRFFDDDGGFVPVVRGVWTGVPVDVTQTENDVTVDVGLPAGIDPEKVDISVEGDILTIRGSSEVTEEEKEKTFFRREIRRGSFERAVRLPAIVRGDKAEAMYEKGVLRISIPKAEESKPKKIAVKVRPSPSSK